MTAASRVLCFAGVILLLAGADARAAADLFERSIEELGQLRVITVSRRSEPLRTASSAIHVITAEDIRRSGFTSIPEILRLAPGVEVARNGAHSWTISIRGFNSDLSNKLLVLIDGRNVYSPLFAGVFWDAQDVLLQDIERIEVISGPGGTLWGANAVNGVVNIITRSAGETQGTFVEVGAGDEQQASLNLRHGWAVSDDLAARAYLKHNEHDAFAEADGSDGVDDWRRTQGGFRVDWDRDERTLVTVQGDAYTAALGSMLRGDFTFGTLPDFTPGDVDISGQNLLARWGRRLQNDSDLRLQAYYDHTSRDLPGTFNETRDTLDIDFQHHFRPGRRHDVVWGAGFRLTSDDLDTTLFATFEPAGRTDRTFSLFAQDEIALLGDKLFLTVGAKLQHNDYTDVEFQPNIRASWNITEQQTLWAAVSRAVRIPARLNTDLRLTAPVDVPSLPAPLYVLVSGTDEYRSEELIAYELGYRAGLTDNLSLDLALYYNDYDYLQTQEPQGLEVVGDPPEFFLLSAMLDNGMQGETYGGSFVANWQPTRFWRLQFQYAWLDMHLGLKPGFSDTGALNVAGNSPENQAAVHSYLELPYNLHLYTGVRYVDELPALGVPDRTAVDVSLGWRPRERFRAALTVRNLNEDAHLEFAGGSLIERGAHLRLAFTF